MVDEQVLVTGASGFIALHVLDVLLSEGYDVIGTVRSKDKADRIGKSFKELYPYAKLEFSIVSDISAPGAFDHVFQDYPNIQHVLHTASPFSFGLGKSMEESYLNPATQGTKGILEATLKFGKEVKHVVVTSSHAAIMNFDKIGDSSFIHTEDTWNPMPWEEAKNSELTAYCASKKYAEKLCWDFLESHKDQVHFSLTTVNPPYVLGPQVFDWGLERGSLNTSAELVNKALKTTPDFEGPFDQPQGLSVDVRDVALLHVLPLRNEKLAGKRLLPVSGTGVKEHDYEDGKFNFQKILDTVNANFPELNGKISKGNSKYSKSYLKTADFFNNDKTTQLTGIEFKKFETSIIDSIKQILDFEKKSKN
ncbi:LAMI_0B00232g1_1 [Lachancea mirantina]|uniref:LAMI_0B00232g1_1 n=1 Tax=Lachancea mirantina TaxID=1230905 RepID=A0A1G4ISV3_9SACH|nr:LAMI_0B00232g1_1 [Lachancea mirantina]